MDSGEFIKSAFWISLRYLWFFGFFAGGSSFNFSGSFPPGGDFDPGGSDFS